MTLLEQFLLPYERNANDFREDVERLIDQYPELTITLGPTVLQIIADLSNNPSDVARSLANRLDGEPFERQSVRFIASSRERLEEAFDAVITTGNERNGVWENQDMLRHNESPKYKDLLTTTVMIPT